METQKIKTSDGQTLKILTKSETSKDVSVENIPGISIEQLNIGQEVKRATEVRGEFKTNDASLTRVNNFYTLNVPDPENEIFSFAIDGIDMTFGIGNFGGNPTLAYTTLETQLQDKLGEMYTVEYVGSGNFTIVKEFERTISYAERDLVRNIEFTGWNEHTKVDVIIDGQTISIDGQTYPSIIDAIDYIISQLDPFIYYTKRESNNLVIARKDATATVITFTNYDRFTYRLDYEYGDTFDNVLNTTTTVDGIDTYSRQSQWIPFRGDWIIRNLVGNNTDTITYIDGLGNNSTTARFGVQLNSGIKQNISKVIRDSGCTATTAYIQTSGGITLATASFVGEEATFNYVVQANVSYRIVCDASGGGYNAKLTFSGPVIGSSGYGTLQQISGVFGNIRTIEVQPVNDFATGYTTSAQFPTTSFGTLSVWDGSLPNSQYFNKVHSFFINRDDYASITASSVTNYQTDPSDNGKGYVFTENNNNVTVINSSYTEIIPTFTNTGNNFYIRVDMMPVSVQIGAYSSVGTSIGTYEKGEQSTTLGDGSATVQGRIFQTDASNYGTIIKLVKGGFIINFDTTVSNIINYTCR